MTTGIWLLLHDIAATDRDHYVDTLHRCYVPEKLARPGHRWLAHFGRHHHLATVIFIDMLECLGPF